MNKQTIALEALSEKEFLALAGKVKEWKKQPLKTDTYLTPCVSGMVGEFDIEIGPGNPFIIGSVIYIVNSAQSVNLGYFIGDKIKELYEEILPRSKPARYLPESDRYLRNEALAEARKLIGKER